MILTYKIGIFEKVFASVHPKCLFNSMQIRVNEKFLNLWSLITSKCSRANFVLKFGMTIFSSLDALWKWKAETILLNIYVALSIYLEAIFHKKFAFYKPSNRD